MSKEDAKLFGVFRLLRGDRNVRFMWKCLLIVLWTITGSEGRVGEWSQLSKNLLTNLCELQDTTNLIKWAMNRIHCRMRKIVSGEKKKAFNRSTCRGVSNRDSFLKVHNIYPLCLFRILTKLWNNLVPKRKIYEFHIRSTWEKSKTTW